MITNPKTFFEQFQNFIEESGLQLKKFKSNLSNYFTKTEAIDTFLGKTDKAESAKTADTATASVTATKATQDASGNIITSTYATKTEVTKGLAGKANASHTHTSASITDLGTTLAPYATTAVMNTELAKRAPVSHTHTVSQITDMPNVVLSVNDVTPDDSGNISINVGVKTVEGRTPDGTGNVSLGLHAVATSGNYNDLANKPSIPATPKAYITETWRSGSEWYRKWSNGLIEQGGVIYTRSDSADITFHKPFSGSSYSISGHCDQFDHYTDDTYCASMIGHVINRSGASCSLFMCVLTENGDVIRNIGYNWHVHWSAVGY